MVGNKIYTCTWCNQKITNVGNDYMADQQNIKTKKVFLNYCATDRFGQSTMYMVVKQECVSCWTTRKPDFLVKSKKKQSMIDNPQFIT